MKMELIKVNFIKMAMSRKIGTEGRITIVVRKILVRRVSWEKPSNLRKIFLVEKDSESTMNKFPITMNLSE